MGVLSRGVIIVTMRSPTLLSAALLALLAGCATSETPKDMEIPPGRYAEAFEAAKDVLRQYRFPLERVDARSGIITTSTKHSAGVLAPWDREQGGLDDEFEQTLNRQVRSVVVEFVRPEAGEAVAGAGVTTPPPDPGDLREEPGPLLLRVSVEVTRVNRPGWRLSTKSIKSSSFATDLDLRARGMQPTFSTVVAEDPDLARRIAERIRSGLD